VFQVIYVTSKLFTKERQLMYDKKVFIWYLVVSAVYIYYICVYLKVHTYMLLAVKEDHTYLSNMLYLTKVLLFILSQFHKKVMFCMTAITT